MRTRSRRSILILIAAVLLIGGLAVGDAISDLQWLALLAVSWAILWFVLRPRLSRDVPVTARSSVTLGAFLISALLVAMLQAFRSQVVLGGVIGRRVGTDPATGDVLGNPRLAGGGLRVRRGTIRDRHGTALAESLAEEDRYRRIVPATAAGEVTGYFSPLLYGTSAIEAAREDDLSGRSGPSPLARAITTFAGREQQGGDIVLTIDLGLQQLAHSLLDGRRGSVIVLDATTGAVLTMASAPSPDPNALNITRAGERADAIAYWNGLIADPASPLLLRPTSALLAPGSVFKVITAAAAIDQGVAQPQDVFDDAGEIEIDGRVLVEANRPDDTITSWSLTQSLGWSLNVVFARLGLLVGASGLRQAAKAWGFDEEIPFDLPIAPSSLEATPSYLDTDVALAETAFGQGQLLVTPMQMALVAAGIANGGTIMRPYLVAAVTGPDGVVRWQATPRPWRTPVRPETADAVAAMMVWAAEEGDILAAGIPGVRVGGKTGTAETSVVDANNAWYIGFADDGVQRLAICVVVEGEGTGGTVALPIAHDVMVAALAADLATPQR